MDKSESKQEVVERNHFVFLVMKDHRGVDREFFVAESHFSHAEMSPVEATTWTEDRAKKMLMSEEEASNLAGDLNAGCGSI